MKKFNYIYLITNKVNGKIYIGKHSTDKLDDGYMGSGVLLSKAKLKYGIENFTKEYLAFCDTKEKLNFLERFYIKKFRAKELGYNISDGGDGGKVYGEINPMKGKHHTQNAKDKISERNKGKHRSEEQKIRYSNSKKGENHPFYKKHLSEEQKLKMSISHIGKQHSKIWRENISKGEKGKSKQKYKWITETGEIKEMTLANVNRWHPNWKKL